MNYYNEVESYVKKNEVSKKYHEITSNNEELINKWNIGRLIVEAQGGSQRAKRGNELIKIWSESLTEKYGSGYDVTNLRRFRQFYECFPKRGTVSRVLNWSHMQYLLPLKDENKRNYYINKIIENNWGVRALRDAIKSNEYERLLNKPEKIEINVNNKYNIASDLKNPIIINVPSNVEIKTEKDLENTLLAQLQYFFSQLGQGFAFIGNQYPIECEGKRQYIDILLFNVKFNSYVVVELKLREIKPQDKGQVESYMKAIDKEVKEPFHNNTVGIIISKKNNNLVAELISSTNIYALTYELSSVV